MDRRWTARDQVIQRLWANYRRLVPDAERIEAALKARGDTWQEDHIAFRTLPGPHTGAHMLERLFTALGYERRDDYHFEAKSLKAFWMAPTDVKGKHSAAVQPKVFISELLPARFDATFQEIVARATREVTSDPLAGLENLAAKAKEGDEAAASELAELTYGYLTAGPKWSLPAVADYEYLRKASEYAGWTLVFGSQVNHFTLCAHLMKSFPRLEGLNDFIVDELGIALNASGEGYIKGSAEVQLEQSATLAAPRRVTFRDGERELPYAFVEFAFRYALEGKKADGQWESYYQGFVTDNADKIFESTNVR